MSRYSLGSKVAEKAAEADRNRREQNSVRPELLAQDKTLLEQAHAEGLAKKKAAVDKPLPPRLRPPNSLFYRLYPPNEKDDPTEKARRYWKAFGDGGDDDETTGPMPSDEAMSGAFAALKFLSGGSSGSASGSGLPGGDCSSSGSGKAPVKAAAAPAEDEDAASLKRKLLEALGGDFADVTGADASAGTAEFREGAVVEIHGLKGAPELNGKRGKLQNLDVASGRWQVDVEGVGPRRLRPDNLRLMQGDAPSSAAPVSASFADVTQEDASKKARMTFL